MTYLEDIRGDWRNNEAVEDVTFTASSGTATAAKAVQDELSYREAVTIGTASLDTEYCVWKVFDETLGGAIPARGDTLTDGDGNVWTILGLSPNSNYPLIFWRCVCSRQR